MLMVYAIAENRLLHQLSLSPVGVADDDVNRLFDGTLVMFGANALLDI